MRVPYSWLQEVVPVTLAVAEVADRLTMAGFEVEEITEVDGESVMDVHINANRGDALSMVGIAREVAALTDLQVNQPVVNLCESGPDVNTLARVTVDAPDLCPRYGARVVRGVKIGPSPTWVQHRLQAAGVRPINNVVDATNYVLLELGQPLHAFDLDTLHDHAIVVRRAHDGELLRTLDGNERTMTTDMLLIADPARPLALAGIMGGEDSEVTATTTNLLLESAHFERTSVRKTARANTLSTEASYRFERIVDPAGVVRALDRVAQLIIAWSGGEAATGVIDVAQPMTLSRTITMPIERINQVLGTAIPRADVLRVLSGLELAVAAEGDILRVAVPSFRPDLLEEMDLIEEVARIYGYEHVPATVPGRVTGAGRLAPELAFEARVRDLLVNAGLFETVSFTLIDYRTLDLLRYPADAPERTQIVALRNPKSEEFTHLRSTLLLSMLDGLRNNARRNIDDAQLFEIGRTFRTADGVGGLRFNYSPSARGVKEDVRVQSAEKLPREQRTAGIAMMGRPWTSRWGGGEREVDFYWLKGMIEQTLSALAVPEVNFRAATHPTLHPGRTAKICVGKAVLGILGEVHPQVVKNFDLPGRAYLAEFNLDVIMELAGSLSAPPLLSRFPTVTRDVAFLAEELQAADQIESVINAAAGEYVESVALFDVYQGSHVPAGWRSLAYRITFRASERTLADAEVDEAMENIWQALRDKIGAKLR